MSNIDFQNGFALGVASKGFNNKKEIKVDSSISIVYATLIEPAIVNVNDGIINADSSASLEE